MQIQNHAILIYQGIWEAIPSVGATELASRVTSALIKDGFSIKDLTSDAGFFQSTAVPFLGAALTPFHVTMRIQVVNGVGYGSEDDVLSIIHHEYNVIVNKFPVSDTIPTIQNPNQSVVDTGQGQITNSPNEKSSSFLGGLFDGVTSLFSDTKILFIGLGLGLIAAVLLIVGGRPRI